MTDSIKLAQAYVEILPSAKGLGKSIINDLTDAGDEAGKAGGKKAGSSFASALGTAAKAAGAVTAAAGTLVGSIIKQSVSGFADFEQLVGGVETLFGTTKKEFVAAATAAGMSVQTALEEYKNFEQGSDKVMRYAADAYKTAGLSANEYMETVTSFSASLLQSLGGDTYAAADYADMAITDMSDNANKMGTSMESIQNAYQGFAKGNYTMLDNLKLGYGGTGAEMMRLIEDAEKLDSTFKASRDEDGKLVMAYADIVDAIHVVQDNLGITGTTAKEASTTISGSLGTMTAAWQNLLVGMGDSSQSIGPLIDQLVDSAMTFGQNLVPVIEQALAGVGEVVTGLAPIIVDMLPGLVETILPGLLESAMSIVESLIAALPSLLQTVITALIGMLPQFINAGMQLFVGLIGAMPEIIATITAALPEIISGITGAIVDNIPALIDAGVQLLVSLVSNLPAIIEGVVAAIPQIVQGLVDAIVEKGPMMVEAGKNLFLGLKDGIKQAVSAVWNAVKESVESIINGAKQLLGIASPSKIFAMIGAYTMEGFAQGILQNEGLVSDAMDSATKLATGTFVSTLDLNAHASGNSAPATSQASVAREVADALRNVRVYIDGNRMVGYLVPGIDTALGVRQAAALRGAI